MAFDWDTYYDTDYYLDSTYYEEPIVGFRNGLRRVVFGLLVGLLGRRRSQVAGQTHARRQGLSFSSRTREREGQGKGGWY